MPREQRRRASPPATALRQTALGCARRPPAHDAGFPCHSGPLQPPFVVERQDGCLADRAGAAAEQRRLAVAFDLDRPAVARLDQQAAAGRAAAAGRGVPVRRRRASDLLRLVQERNRLLHRARASSRRWPPRRALKPSSVRKSRRDGAGGGPVARAALRSSRASRRSAPGVGVGAELVDALPETQFGRSTGDTSRNRGLETEHRVSFVASPRCAAEPRESPAPGLPMTVEAPAHRQRRLLPDARHRLDGAVTRLRT